MLWVDSKCFSQNCVFPQIWWASAHFNRSILFFDRSKYLNLIERVSVCFDRSKLIFDRSNLFQIVFIESLSVSIDWDCFFSIDHNSWNMLFWLFFFQNFSTFSLSPTWLRLHHQFFVVFLQVFCKVFVLKGR